jgi:integrase/recombinase XerD
VRYADFSNTFRDLLTLARIEAHPPSRARVHDLRHSFAVHVLTKWYEEGADVPAKLPSLSTYMGHVNPASTYWYLSGSPELLEQAVTRLEAVHEVES